MKGKTFFKPVYDNSVDTLYPELWTQESLAILEEQMVVANLVYRDFDDTEIADYGDTVNADRPGKFKPSRKGVNDDVVPQDAVSNQLPVVLNQHLYTSFIIRDTERSKSFQELVRMFLYPAISNIATSADRAILGYVPQFLGANAYGQLGGLNATNAKQYMLGTRQLMVQGLLPPTKHAVITPDTEANILEVGDFTNANTVGDDGTAMREAHIGRKYGINWFMGQNTPFVSLASSETVTGAVNNGAGYAIGDTAITVDGFSAAIVDGSFVTIVGSMYPYQVASTVGGATPTQINLASGLRDAVVDDAVVTVYTPVAVDLVAGYASGYVKEIHVDGYSAGYPPQVGQIAKIGTEIYTVISVDNDAGTECDVLLNRPLAAAVADGATIALGPAGSYNFAFSPEALGLVVRPLALPMSDTGVRASVVNHNGLSMRTTIAYDPYKQGHLVTVDMLCGVAVFDTAQGFVMLG